MLSIAINRSLNRFSNRDRVVSCDILPTTAVPPPAASSAHQYGTAHCHMPSSLLHYQIQLVHPESTIFSWGVL